jgi:adenylate cyclase
LVKLLGDGAMLHFRDATSGLAATLNLVGALGEADQPAHAGMHAGPVIARDGDYYASTVNLASRVAGLAGASEVLVTDAVVANVDAGFRFEPYGCAELKGIRDRVPLYRAADL